MKSGDMTGNMYMLAMEKFPDPKFTIWYLTKFPKKLFFLMEIGLFIGGFSMTVIKGLTKEEKLAGKIQGWFTILFCIILFPAAICHITAWTLKRNIERKRAKFLGITFKEYQSIWN